MPSQPTIRTACSNSTIADSSLVQTLKSAAFELGFDRCDITPADIPERDQHAYERWAEQGLASGMAYMTRNPLERTRIQTLYPNTKSVVVLGVSYYQGPCPEKPGVSYGRVARYAWGLDYHTIISQRLHEFIIRVKKILGEGCEPLLALDTKPLLERALAASAGLGFVGKNTVLILPRKPELLDDGFHMGSWVFLAEVLLNVELPTEKKPPVKGGCGECTRCLTACPTGAFKSAYTLDAGLCISYLTIENKGSIPRELRPKLGEWIFGCDVCQDVCPFNGAAYETRWPEFRADRGVGAWVSLKEILTTPTQSAFKKKWEMTPLGRPKRKGLIRNACVVAGNLKDESIVVDIENLLADSEPMIREHALWALNEIRPGARTKATAENLLKQETDTNVITEAQTILHG